MEVFVVLEIDVELEIRMSGFHLDEHLLVIVSLEPGCLSVQAGYLHLNCAFQSDTMPTDRAIELHCANGVAFEWSHLRYVIARENWIEIITSSIFGGSLLDVRRVFFLLWR